MHQFCWEYLLETRKFVQGERSLIPQVLQHKIFFRINQKYNKTESGGLPKSSISKNEPECEDGTRTSPRIPMLQLRKQDRTQKLLFSSGKVNQEWERYGLCDQMECNLHCFSSAQDGWIHCEVGQWVGLCHDLSQGSNHNLLPGAQGICPRTDLRCW